MCKDCGCVIAGQENHHHHHDEHNHGLVHDHDHPHDNLAWSTTHQAAHKNIK